MTTRDNVPPPADWVPMVGNRCGGCGASCNLCRCLTVADDAPCCGSCSHQAVAGPNVPYYGD